MRLGFAIDFTVGRQRFQIKDDPDGTQLLGLMDGAVIAKGERPHHVMREMLTMNLRGARSPRG